MSRGDANTHPRGVFEPEFTTDAGHAIFVAIDSEGACVARCVVKDLSLRKEVLAALRSLLPVLDPPGARKHLEVVEGGA